MLTVARLREVLDYNPLTGEFTWKVATSNRVKVGEKAGAPGVQGYQVIGLDGILYRRARLAWLFMTGEFPTETVDHIDLDRGNDRWANLRAATMSQNQANQGRPAHNTSGLKGVHLVKRTGRWRAQVAHQRKKRSLGCYGTKEEAQAAYIAGAEALYGAFARAE